MPRSKYIPRASFSSIIILNEVQQVNVLYMPYDKIGQITYLFCLNIVNVALKYKVSILIDAYSVRNRQGILISKNIARAIEKIYDDPECLLVWLETFLMDKDSEFRENCKKLMREHNVKIQKVESKCTMDIV